EIRVAISVEVCCHAPLATDGEVGSRAAADIGEVAPRVAEERAPRQAAMLLPATDVGLRIRLHDEQIDPAVVVVVEGTQPASGHRRRVGRDTEAKRTLTQVEPDPTGDVRQANPFEARARGV